MKMKVFTVYDSKAEAFATPFFMQSTGQALRAWTDTCNDEQTQINRHPEDFTLFHLGDFDSFTGKFENLPTPQSLGIAVEFKTVRNTQKNWSEEVSDQIQKNFAPPSGGKVSRPLRPATNETPGGQQ